MKMASESTDILTTSDDAAAGGFLGAFGATRASYGGLWYVIAAWAKAAFEAATDYMASSTNGKTKSNLKISSMFAQYPHLSIRYDGWCSRPVR